MAFVHEKYEAIQYDGANGALIASKIYNGEVQTDTGTALTIIDQGSDYHISLNQWVVLRDLNSTGAPYVKPMAIVDQAGFEARFNPVI